MEQVVVQLGVMSWKPHPPMSSFHLLVSEMTFPQDILSLTWDLWVVSANHSPFQAHNKPGNEEGCSVSSYGHKIEGFNCLWNMQQTRTCGSKQFFCRYRSHSTSLHQRLTQYFAVLQFYKTCTGSSLLVWGKQWDMAQICGPYHLCGKPDVAPGLWLWPGPPPVVVVICRMGQRLEGLSLPL